MSGSTPIANAPTTPVMIPATLLVEGVLGPRALSHSPPPHATTGIKNLINAIKGLNCRMDTAAIVKRFEW